MRVEESSPEALIDVELRALSGERLQASARWLQFAKTFLGDVLGRGARLGVLVANEGREVLAALPMVRLDESADPRPFPMDLRDFFFGLWIRNLDPNDKNLRARAALSRGFGALLGAVQSCLDRTLVLHPPLSPVSDVLVAPRLAPSQIEAALAALLFEARRIGAREGRSVFVPRVMRRERDLWGRALSDLVRVPCYSNAELLPAAQLDRDPRQMIKRNRKLMERAGVTVEVTREAPRDVPFGALFSATAGRHRDPSPCLDDRFFRVLGATFSNEAFFLIARHEGRAAGFVAVLRHGASWEAFKCGTDRSFARGAPVYLDLIYGRIREMAAREGIARVELGPGELDVKRRYGASTTPMESFVALPPGFLGSRALLAYLQAVGAGIIQNEGQVERVATTPK